MKKRHSFSLRKRQNRVGYLFMTPWIAGFLLFTLFPFAATIALSFMEVSSTIRGYEIRPVGLDNSVTAFFRNTEFVPALGEFLMMIVPYTFMVVVVSFIVAYLLNHITRGRALFRTIYFLPVIIMSGPVMWQLLDSQTVIHGMALPDDFDSLFLLSILRSYSPAFANLLSGVFRQLSTILWFTGIPVVLFINGLQKINPSMYEAARIDSANEWQMLWKITMPQIRPVALISTIFTIAQLSTYNISSVYNLIRTATANTSQGLGFAATYAWIYSLLVLLLMGLSFLIFRQPRAKEVSLP